MFRPGKGCDLTKREEEIQKIGNNFKKDVGNGIHDPDIMLTRLFEDVFVLPVERLGAFTPTKGQVRTFQIRLDQIKKAVQKGEIATSLGKLFYNPTALAKKSPHLGQLLNDYINTGHYFRGHQAASSNSFRLIVDSLQKESKARSINDTFSKKDWKKAVKEADRFDKEIEDTHIAIANGENGLEGKLQSLIKQEGDFYLTGQGKLFGDFLDIVENKLPKLQKTLNKEFAEKIQKAKVAGQKITIKRTKIDERLSDVTDSAPMRNAIEEYLHLMDSSHKILKNGLRASIDSIKESLVNVRNKEEVDEIGKRILEKVEPSKEVGYYPHYRRATVDFLDNLMPYMQKLTDSTIESIRNNDVSIDKAIGDINGYIAGRAKSRELEVSPEEYSRNLLPNIKRYADEVAKYNYIAHVNLSTKKILNDVKSSFRGGDDLTGYGVAVKNMIMDIHNAATGGERFENPNMEAAMRSVLGAEFVSKLGLNVRGSLRNATQGLLNIVEWGPKIYLKSKLFYLTNRGLRESVDQRAKEAGLLFEETIPELEEAIGAEPIITAKLKLTDSETVELNKPSKFQRFERDVVRKAAHKSGYLMRKVENFNRKATFRLAYYRMYEQLNSSSQYHNFLKTQEGLSDSSIKKDIESRAFNYAIRMTTALHFDYSQYSKAKALRHPVGRMLGQFQHYGFKFFEYNVNLAKEAKDDILAGEIGGDRAWKAYRMGLTYFLAPTLASAVTGVNWSNLVEHNTKEKIGQLWALFTGDDDAIKKAFYGRGPLTGLIGAPLISDLLALGHIYEWWDMDEDSMAALLTGYRDYASVSGDRKAYETMRLINTQLGRTLYQSLPLITSGHLGAAAQFETGLYPTKGAKELQKNVIGMKKNLPTELQQSLDQLIREAKAHKKKAIASPF